MTGVVARSVGGSAVAVVVYVAEASLTDWKTAAVEAYLGKVGVAAVDVDVEETVLEVGTSEDEDRPCHP